MNKFSMSIKASINGDEYYTPRKAVEMIVPYVLRKGYKKIWCPFDKSDSEFVKVFSSINGLSVAYGHIDEGQNFFDFKVAQGDIVVSNPPFSKRDMIFEQLFNMRLPFALIMNFNGLYDSKKRAKLFRENEHELLIPYGRMKFYQKERGFLNSPNFQSIYVCSRLLDKQIVFDKTVF